MSALLFTFEGNVMAMTYSKIKEIEFVRMINTGTITKFIVQEDVNKPYKFCINGIDPKNMIVYSIRHGRTSDYRSRTLEYILKFFKKNNVLAWETLLTKQPD